MLRQLQKEKLVSLWIVVVVLLFLTLSIGSLSWMARQHAQDGARHQLQQKVASHIQLFDYQLRQQQAEILALSRQFSLQEAIVDAAASPAARATLGSQLHAHLARGNSALIAYDHAGRVLARAGESSPRAGALSLRTSAPGDLQWLPNQTLSMRIDVLQSGRKIGALLVEKRLESLQEMQAQFLGVDPQSRLIVCVQDAQLEVKCQSPNAKTGEIGEYLLNGAEAQTMRAALNGQPGVASESGSILVYMPVEASGMGVMLALSRVPQVPGVSSQILLISIALLLLIVGALAWIWFSRGLPALRQWRAKEESMLSQQERLQHDATRYKALLCQVDEGIISINVDGRIRDVNSAALRMLGYEAGELEGRHVGILMAKEHAEKHDSYVQQYMRTGQAKIIGTSRDVEILRKDGGKLQIELRLSEVKLPDEHLFISAMRDITKRKAAESHMLQLINIDTLTNLPNRHLLMDRAGQALMQAARHEHQFGLLFIDLDQFKSINDTLGHSVGDRLLQTVASRILNCVREEDTVARQGGDEFIVILPNVRRFEDVALVAQKILNSLRGVYAIDGAEIHTSASIGVAIYPQDGADVETLMRHADTAMYYAKATGRNNFQFFTPAMNIAITERMEVESKLRYALGRNEFLLHYQPIVNLHTGQISSTEALIRWKPEGGMIGPDRFIPVAEETGLIVPIGEWVLRTALHTRQSWQVQGIDLPRMVVNMSARQFAQKNLVASIGRLLQEVALEPEQLGIEITESLLMDRPEDSVRTLKTLSSMGVQISVDDFGTGYSSLSYLKRFPLDKLKIDRSFVRDIATDKDDAAIVTAIIAMAHSLKVSVVAEGVETAEQLAFLRERGCDEFQGYYFSRPVPSDDLLQTLNKGIPQLLN